MNSSNIHTVIIGNGIAGVSCARHLRKLSDEKITIISGETPYFFSRTALMYVFMGQMRFEHTKPYEDHFWRKNRIDLLQDWVVSVDTQSRSIHLQDKGLLHYDRLIIASGSKPRKAGWQGENLKGVQGFYSVEHLRLMEDYFKTDGAIRYAVVVGGGLIGVELAEMVRSRGVEVTMLIREPRFWARFLDEQESQLVAKHLKAKGVKLVYNAEVLALTGEDGYVKGIQLKDGATIPVDWAGIAIGVEPNIDFLRGSGIACEKGVLIDQQFQTNVEGVYAIGDCAQFESPENGQSEIYQVWYTGRIMGETLPYILHGKAERFQPGPWFNSAKFFELEFQTYGEVQAVVNEGEKAFTWVDINANKSIKVVFDVKTNKFLGINAIGIRISHEKMAAYLNNSWSVIAVLRCMDEWLFDGEFTVSVTQRFIEDWNLAFPHFFIQSKKLKWWSLNL